MGVKHIYYAQLNPNSFEAQLSSEHLNITAYLAFI